MGVSLEKRKALGYTLVYRSQRQGGDRSTPVVQVESGIGGESKKTNREGREVARGKQFTGSKGGKVIDGQERNCKSSQGSSSDPKREGKVNLPWSPFVSVRSKKKESRTFRLPQPIERRGGDVLLCFGGGKNVRMPGEGGPN